MSKDRFLKVKDLPKDLRSQSPLFFEMAIGIAIAISVFDKDRVMTWSKYKEIDI